MAATIEQGDIIAVTTSDVNFSGCLMFVDEVKKWGVQAGMILPDGSTTYVRLNNGEFIRMTSPDGRIKMAVGKKEEGNNGS